MYYKITSGSFTYEDSDGNEQTVTGDLVILAPTDPDIMQRGDTHLGNVAFVTTSDDAGDDTSDEPRTASKPAARKTPPRRK